MTRPNEITLRRDDPEPALDLVDGQKKARVKVLIAGAPAEVTKLEAHSITMKAPSDGGGPWSIVVTTLDDKFLTVLGLEYDPEKNTFAVKKQETIADDN